MKKILFSLFLLTLLSLSFGSDVFAKNISSNTNVNAFYSLDKKIFENYVEKTMNTNIDKNIELDLNLIKYEYVTGDTFYVNWKNNLKNDISTVGLLNVKGKEKIITPAQIKEQVENQEFSIEITDNIPTGDYIFFIMIKNVNNNKSYFNYSKVFKIKTNTKEIDDNLFTNISNIYILNGKIIEYGKKITDDKKLELVKGISEEILSYAWYYIDINNNFSGFCNNKKQNYGLKDYIKEFKKSVLKILIVIQIQLRGLLNLN
jgi:hypothetical protein